MEFPTWAGFLLSVLIIPFLGVLITIDRRLLKVEITIVQALKALTRAIEKLDR